MTNHMSAQEMAVFARWFIAEGGTLAEFIDCLERPYRWQPEIAAANAWNEALIEAERS